MPRRRVVVLPRHCLGYFLILAAARAAAVRPAAFSITHGTTACELLSFQAQQGNYLYEFSHRVSFQVILGNEWTCFLNSQNHRTEIDERKINEWVFMEDDGSEIFWQGQRDSHDWNRNVIRERFLRYEILVQARRVRGSFAVLLMTGPFRDDFGAGRRTHCANEKSECHCDGGERLHGRSIRQGWTVLRPVCVSASFFRTLYPFNTDLHQILKLIFQESRVSP
jgi:hypothetical protein